jgi:hypothetical protein
MPLSLKNEKLLWRKWKRKTEKVRDDDAYVKEKKEKKWMNTQPTSEKNKNV